MMCYVTAYVLLAMTMLCPGVVQAETGLATLFTTPAQRALLDRLPLKSGNQSTRDAAATDYSMAPIPAPPKDQSVKNIKIDGFMINSKGASTTWLKRDDGSAVSSEDKNITSSGGATGQVKVHMQRERKQISLKPGQEFDTNTGLIRDSYMNSTQNRTTDTGPCRTSKSPEGDTLLVCEPSH